MGEVVAVEYREGDWDSVEEMAQRVAQLADGFAEAELAAVGLLDLIGGVVCAPCWAEKPAVLFGLRAKSLEGAVAFGAELSLRGYTGVYSWDEGLDDKALAEEVRSTLVGFGLVEARGGDRVVYHASPADIRAALREEEQEQRGGPAIWMPAPDRFGRTVDGLFLEEAGRRGVSWVWVYGGGINPVSPGDAVRAQAPVIEARRDDGRRSVQEWAQWAAGDRLERTRARLVGAADRPRRWIRELTGWQGR